MSATTFKVALMALVTTLTVTVGLAACGDIDTTAPNSTTTTTTTTVAPTTTTTTVDPAVIEAWLLAVQEKQEQARVAAEATRQRQQRRTTSTNNARNTGSLTPAQNACAIPDYICRRESNMTTNAKNPHSTASGKYQFLDSTWNGYGGYAHASDAPEDVQDRKATELWNGGKGCSHWEAC